MAVSTPQPSSPTADKVTDGRHGQPGPATASPAGSSKVEYPLKPIGIHNESNTCFLNSTFQALSATAPLTSLLSVSPLSPIYPLSDSSLPAPAIDPKLVPSLHDDVLEPPLYGLTPVTRAFTQMLHKAWRMKEAGGGTSGAGETSSKRSMSLVPLLREIARKYDQYDDYSQQDAHELLRHLLDSMEMEEKDAIKKLQPNPPTKSRRRGSKTPQASANRAHLDHMISPLHSPLPSPAVTRPSSPTHVTVDPMADTVPQSHPQASVTGQLVAEVQAMQPFSALVRNDHGAVEAVHQVSDEERLVPFVDVLFGGSLASVVVSHTYEGFLDISLSLKGDDPKPRKRDRLRAMARKLRPGKSTPRSPEQPLNHALSDGEFSEADTPSEKNGARRRSLDQDDRDSTLSRSSSNRAFGSLKPKSSFSFKRKGSRSVGTSPVVSASNSIKSQDIDRTPPTSQPGSPRQHPHRHHHQHGPGPTPAQAAYISRILTPPAGTADANDPLARLRAANNGAGLGPNPVDGLAIPAESGLVESLRAFTSVEVLEGENAFACHKCWKIKHGRYARHEATVREEDEDALVQGIEQSNQTSQRSQYVTPSISIVSSASESNGSTAQREPEQRPGRTQRDNSLTSTTSYASARAPSPLRRQLDEGDALAEQMSTTTLSSTCGSDSVFTVESSNGTTLSTEAETDADAELGAGHDDASSGSDGLSDSGSSGEEGRPKLRRRKTNHAHVVMGRAFKRYLIAKAPEVLVFHFKRFKQTHKSNYGFSSFYDLKKIDDPVSFPETLDLAPFLAPNRRDYKVRETPEGPRAAYMEWPNPDQGPSHLDPVMYKLYAVVVHLGTMIGGHYIAYCLVDPEKMFGNKARNDSGVSEMATPMFDAVDKSSVTGPQGVAQARAHHEAEERPHEPAAKVADAKVKEDRRVWCFCSDTSIRLASLEEVLSQKAYLCFYERVRS
ncbi:hypothetical protein IAU60_002179 [Kwoniella sp. DSM 27419]